MQSAVVPDASLPEVMSWAEICERYPERWVCLVDVEWGEPEALEVRRGRVLDHAPTRRELDERTRGARSVHRDARCYLTTAVDGVSLSPRWLA